MLSLNIKLAGCEAGLSIFRPGQIISGISISLVAGRRNQIKKTKQNELRVETPGRFIFVRSRMHR